jgi:hypothetical protein
MTSAIDSLHKILKDETRRKIIFKVNEKGIIGYTDLMESLNIKSTGTLNYHLKVLGDLLKKNDLGQYTLSEKGQVAFKVLTEFPEGPPADQAKKWKTIIAGLLAAANSVSLIVSLGLYFIGYIDWHFFSSQIIYSLVAFLVALIIFKLPTSRQKYDPDRARKLTGIFFVLGGAIFTSIFLFFTTGVLLMTILGTRIPGGTLGNAFLLWAFGFGPILGAVIGYIVFKRSKYSKPSFYSPF